MQWVGKAKGWMLLRDGKFYRAYPTRTHAEYEKQILKPGSKHRWTIRRIVITELA